MKKSLFYSLLLVTNWLFAQQKEYFQQEVNYVIDVVLDDVKHEITATETIEYTNNSPDVLKEIYMHIWPNAYRDLNTALANQFIENGEAKFHRSKVSQRGFIDQLDFKVNGVVVKWNHDLVYRDIAIITLNEELRPGEKLVITTPFHVKLPDGIYSRLGHMGQAYQITQWYPKPAVYDKNGWNAMPYLNQGEFYSEFGTFDVTITLPKNYVVGATGDLVNGEAELEWLKSKVKATEAITEFDTKNLNFPPSDPELKTLHYRQSNVHDFAWFADKRYHVLKGEVELPHSKRKVDTWVMFTNAEAQLWKKSIQYMNDAIYYYSLWNGDYPYTQATAVDGALSAGAGMEYPTITVIGRSGNDFLLETVIVHEVGHNWFYGILASNERKYPWMDEGMNSFNELRYIRTKYPDKKLADYLGNEKIAKMFDLDQYKQKAQYELSYLINARRNMDQAPQIPADEFTELNYGGIVYSKTAIIFDYLLAYLGDDAMNKALQHYYEKWKFKHPEPEDVKKAFEESTGKNLSWVFDDLIKTTKILDYKIVDADSDGGKISITVKNSGEINGPFVIYGLKDDKPKASIWYEGFEGKQTFDFIPGEYDEYRLDYNHAMPEITRKNNSYRAQGIFKKIEPLKLQFLASVENPYRTQIDYFPIMGWNKYNKFMAGVAFYNNPIPQKKFEYVLAPMYSTGTNNVAGSATIAYNFFPDHIFRNIRLSTSYNRYAIFESVDKMDFHYGRLCPKIDFELKQKDDRSPITQNIILRSVNVQEDHLSYFIIDNGFELGKRTGNYSIYNLTYRLNNKHILHPYSLDISVEQHQTFIKSYIEGKYKLPYNAGKKGIDLRVFAGRFLFKDGASPRFGFNMHDRIDYMYDHIFIGRNEVDGILSKQFVMDDGGFKNQVGVLQSMTWLTSVNLQAAIPKLPLALYGDAGLANNAKEVVYDAGVAVVIIPKIFEIYFPFLVSSNKNLGKSYKENISFTLNLTQLNPFKLTRNFSL